MCQNLGGRACPSSIPPCSDSPGRCCQWGCKTLCWRRVRSCWKPFGMQILRFSTWPWSREEACPYSPRTRDSQTLLSRNFNLDILSNIKYQILNSEFWNYQFIFLKLQIDCFWNWKFHRHFLVYFDLNRKLLPKRINKKMIDSEFRIGCWHVVNKVSSNNNFNLHFHTFWSNYEDAFFEFRWFNIKIRLQKDFGPILSSQAIS